MGVVIVVSDEGLGGVAPLARAASDRGEIPVLFTGPVPEAQLAAWAPLYKRVRVLDAPYDVDTLASAATEEAASSALTGILTCYDGLAIPVARAAARLGLRHPALPGLVRSRNKYAGRLATRAAGLRTPRCALISAVEECGEAATRVGFPAIVKPVNGMASHLVRRVEDLPSLERAYRELATRLTRSFPGNYSQALEGHEQDGGLVDPRRSFLLEQLLVGEEYSAETVVRGGQVERVILFHKFLVDPENFFELGFTSPGLTEREGREPVIWDHIERALAAHGVDNATNNIEIIDAADGPYVVEINAGRPGGQLMVAAARKARGVDLIAEALALQCGWEAPPRAAPSLSGRVTTLTVFPPDSGRLVALDGLDDASRLPGVVDVVPFCKPGDVLDVRDKEVFAVNFLVAGIEARDALVDLSARLYETVRFTLEPLPSDETSGPTDSRGDHGKLR